MASVTFSQTYRLGNVPDSQFVAALIDGNKKGLTRIQVAEKLGLLESSFTQRYYQRLRRLRADGIDTSKLELQSGYCSKRGCKMLTSQEVVSLIRRLR